MIYEGVLQNGPGQNPGITFCSMPSDFISDTS